jgi:hypothetical protein
MVTKTRALDADCALNSHFRLYIYVYAAATFRTSLRDILWKIRTATGMIQIAGYYGQFTGTGFVDCPVFSLGKELWQCLC